MTVGSDGHIIDRHHGLFVVAVFVLIFVVHLFVFPLIFVGFTLSFEDRTIVCVDGNFSF